MNGQGLRTGGTTVTKKKEKKELSKKKTAAVWSKKQKKEHNQKKRKIRSKVKNGDKSKKRVRGVSDYAIKEAPVRPSPCAAGGEGGKKTPQRDPQIFTR